MQLAGLGWGQFKPLLTEALVARLAPLQARYRELCADPGLVLRVLEDGRCVACWAYECLDAYATTAVDDAVAALSSASSRPPPPLQ